MSSALTQRLRKHFGRDPSRLAVVEQMFAFHDRPNLHLALEELVGAGALVWCWRRFGLADPTRRAAFLRSGRLPRDLVG